MQSALQISSGVISSARRIVIYGPPGIGKSTSMSLLPKEEVLFLDVEGGTNNIDINRIRVMDYDEFFENLKILYADPKHYGIKYLVIDGLDTLDSMIVMALCKQSGVESIEQVGGYGRGYTMAAEMLQKLLRILNMFVDDGVNVIMIGHSTLQHIDEPHDLTGKGYDHYTLQMANAKKAVPLILEWADAVLFYTYEATVIEAGGKLKSAGNKRVIYTEFSSAHEAKNRFSLPKKMLLNEESILQILNIERKGTSYSA